MSLGTILQTIIAVIFIYLILSLITSEIQEAIASIFEFRAKRLKESIKQLLGEDCLILENGKAYISGFKDNQKSKFQELAQGDININKLEQRNFGLLKNNDYFYFKSPNDYNNLQNPHKVPDKDNKLDNLKLDQAFCYDVNKKEIYTEKKQEFSNQDLTNNYGLDFDAGDKFVIINKKILPIFQFEQRASEANGKQVKSLTDLLYEKSLIHSLNQSSTSILSLLGFSQRIPKWILKLIVLASTVAIVLSIFVLKSVLLSIIAMLLTAIIIVGSAIINRFVLARHRAEWRQNRKSKGPSYIEPELFSKALLEVIQDNLEKRNKFVSLEDSISSLIAKLNVVDFYSPAISKLIQIAESLKLEDKDQNLSNFKTKLAELFREAQERSSGVYKRNAKGLSFVLGFLIAMIANAEAFYIFGNLSKDNNSFNDRVVNRLEEAKRTSESGFLSSPAEENNQGGFGENEERIIRTILDDIETLPFGWNFEQELEAQNLTELIAILDQKVDDDDCFTSDVDNDKNEKCFDQFLANIEKNPHLENYFQPNKNSQYNKDTWAKTKFIYSLNRVEKCLNLDNINECIQEKYILFLLENNDINIKNKNFNNQSNSNKCLQDNEYSKNCNLLLFQEVTVNKYSSDNLNSLKVDYQNINFPTTYDRYRQQLKNDQLSQRIENIRTSNQISPTKVNAQVIKQGGWFKVIGGWLVSAIAIAMGAPFWFDLLGKVMNVRNAGEPLEKSKKTKQSGVAEK